MKIAFVGHAAVGKDTLAEYVSKKLSIPTVSSSDFIRAHIKENNLGGLDRENLKKVVNELRAKHGGDHLVHLALKMYPEKIILTGLRAVDEVTTFKNKNGIVIAVTASAETRYQLAVSRNRIGESVTFEEWLRAQAGDDNNKDTREGNVSAVIEMAHHKIENESSLSDLFSKCDQILESFFADKNSSLS